LQGVLLLASRWNPDPEWRDHPDLRRRALLPRRQRTRTIVATGVVACEQSHPMSDAESSPSAREGIIRARVAGTWAFRTRAEIQAAARFARMAIELAEVGATEVVARGAKEASDDELRHRDLCARLAARWGEPNALQHVPPRERIGRSDMDPRDRLLWEVVAVCCVSETMNTSLMTRCLEVAKDEEIRSTLHELLKDEVNHARLGWAHLAAERAAGRGAFLRDVLPLMLEASVEPGFLQGQPQVPWTDELFDYGELPSSELIQIYRDTLNLVVFPGLDATGVDTSKGRAWLEAQLST
jgi:hypothetical protein